MKNYFKEYVMAFCAVAILTFVPFMSQAQIGVNTDDAIKIGNTTTNSDGTIRFTGTDFEGYFNAMWHSLTGGGGAGVWNTSGSDIYYNAGDVGIGVMMPDEQLHVGGTTKIEMNSTTGSPHLLLVEDDFSPGGSTRVEFNHSDNPTDYFELRSFVTSNAAVDQRIGWYYNGGARVIYNESESGLGIGTASPSATLDVIGDGEFNYDSNGSDPTLDLWETQDDDFARLFFRNAANPANRWAISARTGTTFDHILGWYYDGSPRVIYNEDLDGFGIGTSSPSEKLEVAIGGGIADGIRIDGDGTGDARLSINNDNGNHYLFDDADDSNNLKIESANGFAINTNGPTKRVDIRSNGEVGINTDANANYRLFVDSNNDIINIFSRADGTGNREAIYGSAISAGAQLKRGVRGNIAGTGGTGTSQGVYGSASTTPSNFWAVYAQGDLWYTGSLKAPSDQRLKKNIADLEPVLDRLMQIETVTYEFDRERYPYANLANGPQIGFIAQNIGEHFPTLVEEEKHMIETSFDIESGEATYEEVNILGMSQIEMIPVLTKAIQEQQELINYLLEEIETLKEDR